MLAVPNSAFAEYGDLSDATYQVKAGSIVATGTGRSHNRPLYANHISSVALAGDLPSVKLIVDPVMHGQMIVGFVSRDNSKWLFEFENVTALYSNGAITWIVRDDMFPGIEIKLMAVYSESSPGFIMRAEVEGASDGDKLVWAYGAASKSTEPFDSPMWSLDPAMNAPSGIAYKIFLPDDCVGNKAGVDGQLFYVEPTHVETSPATLNAVAVGKCSKKSSIRVADASKWASISELGSSEAAERPLIYGETDELDDTVCWMVMASTDEKKDEDAGKLGGLAEAFDKSIARAREISNQIMVNTPNKYVDAAVSCVCSGIDGVYYPPVYVHGGMAWNLPYPGWRTIYGPTALGWHSNVMQEIEYYISHQQKEETFTKCGLEPASKHTLQAGDSRYHAQGRIQRDQGCYNFQEVFFDMAIREWRYTADRKLAEILYPALELHLEYMQECFDPDENGVYESYINVWASDSVWYAGRETAQSSSYAYTGHLAASEMAHKLGNTQKAKWHREMAGKIKNATVESLWMPERGHLAESREITKRKRQHPSACIYTVCLTTDADMLDEEQAVSQLYYTEWGLERVKSRFDGEKCWSSNWAPYIWSIRELEPAECFHLALSYYQMGLSDEAWELVKGFMYDSVYDGPVPGAISSVAGVDFTDATSMFARVVVEGLFGYDPDYPNGKVSVYPQFPVAWKDAAIATPDFALEYEDKNSTYHYTVRLEKAADIDLRVPVFARAISNILVDGKSYEDYTLERGYGRGEVVIHLKNCRDAEVEIYYYDAMHPVMPVEVAAKTGEEVVIEAEGAGITTISDPQGALEDVRLENGKVYATASARDGYHMVFADVACGQLDQKRLFKVHIINEKERAALKARHLEKPDEKATWEKIDLSEYLNADVASIYEQEYLTPRPDTCSAQLGSDGWSGWCQVAWQMTPPEMDTNMADKMASEYGEFITETGVPFGWNAGGNNIAFTSRWDNYPEKVQMEIGTEGKALWMLVAGSASHMQMYVPHAEVRLNYADGSTDVLEIVHPYNYLTLGNDYTQPQDAYPLPDPMPVRTELGTNCKAMVLNIQMQEGVTLDSRELETLSREVVVGIAGVSVMK